MNSAVKISIATSILLVLTTATLRADTPPPEEGTHMNNVVQVDPANGLQEVGDVNRSKMIGDDTLPKKKIFTGEHYLVNIGENIEEVEVVIDEKGRRLLLKKGADPNDPKSYIDVRQLAGDNPLNKDSEYDQYMQDYKSYIEDLNVTQKRTDFQKEKELKEKRQKELERRKVNFRSIENHVLKNRNVLSGATSVMNNMQTDINYKNAPTKLKNLEKNATKYYSSTMSATDFSKQDKFYLENGNLGVLTKAYELLPALKQELEKHVNGEYIKCQITRPLIPGYVCPIPGKDGVIFSSASAGTSGLIRVDIKKAKNECDSFCHTDPNEHLCQKEKLINGGVDWTVFSGSQEMYPGSGGSFPFVFSKDLDNRLLTKTVRVKIKVSHSKGTDEEVKNFISSNGLKFKVNLSYRLENPVKDDDSQHLQSSPTGYSMFRINDLEQEINIPLSRSIDKLTVRIYKPYVSDNIFSTDREDKFFEEAKEKYGLKITLEGIYGKYGSDGVYYCIPQQAVPSKLACNGETRLLTYGDEQFKYLCFDDEHPKGPGYNGGYFDIESCTNACIMYKKCEPTYVSYSQQNLAESAWFKPFITCVDDPTNKDCTDEKCKKYFIREYNAAINGDNSKRPFNEIVVYNDDTYKYTIKNGALTDVVRPKIDLNRELNLNPGNEAAREVIRENEEKDIALANMIERGTYNRSIYKIGEDSPMNLAYIKAVENNKKTYLGALLKPNSKDFENGKEYYVYMLMKVEHIYRPNYGMWYRDGHMVDLRDTPVVFKDIAYVVKKDDGVWIPFKRELFAEYFSEQTEFGRQIDYPNAQVGIGGTDNDARPIPQPASDGGDDADYSTTTSNPNKTVVLKDAEWVETGQYAKREYKFYNASNNSWWGDPVHTQAPYIDKTKFTKARSVYLYKVSDYIEKDIIETPGILIRKQVPINHETEMVRIYNGDVRIHGQMSRPFNYSVYLLYSDIPLTYGDLWKKIFENEEHPKKPWNTKYAFFDFLNAQKFRSGEVKHDGAINNKVKMFLMGTKSNMSVAMHIDPSLSERGKRLYKFIFLFDEADPLINFNEENDNENGN